MEKIRISAVKYANTYPFIYGLTETGFDKKVILETDHPADCASKLISGRADLGLIPVAALPFVAQYSIVSDFCIGAKGEVRTVLLLSNCPFEDIETIFLDYRSRSSVMLSKVLARRFWNREFRWMNTSKGFDFRNIGLTEAVVLIGDQCFEYERSFRYKYDLASEWIAFSGLPFVFACWASNRSLSPEFVVEFNEALRYGVMNLDKVVLQFRNAGTITGDNLHRYLTMNIDYILDNKKKEGMEKFLDLIKDL